MVLHFQGGVIVPEHVVYLLKMNFRLQRKQKHVVCHCWALKLDLKPHYCFLKVLLRLSA